MSLKRRANATSAEYSTSEDDESLVDGDFDRSTESSSKRVDNSSRQNRGPVTGRASSTKRPCLNRNALLARENRQRKKEYLQMMENELTRYKRDKKNLSSMIQRRDIDLKRLRAEVAYLRNVLDNSSSITRLLRSMNDALSAGRAPDCATSSKNTFDEDGSVGGRTVLWPPGGPANGGGDASELTDHAYTRSCGRSTADRDLSSFLSGGQTIPPDENSLEALTKFDDGAIFASLNFDDKTIARDFGLRSESCDLFDDLENGGICLHVNSDKVSLEFCSVCRLNSVNSAE